MTVYGYSLSELPWDSLACYLTRMCVPQSGQSHKGKEVSGARDPLLDCSGVGSMVVHSESIQSWTEREETVGNEGKAGCAAITPETERERGKGKEGKSAGKESKAETTPYYTRKGTQGCRKTAQARGPWRIEVVDKGTEGAIL